VSTSGDAWGFETATPWMAPYAVRASRLAAKIAQGCRVCEALSGESASIALASGPLRFVPGDSAPPGEAYEAFIHRTARVPTRDNLHDFFNGLVWLHYPRTKRRLNELQAEEIVRGGIGATRGPLRDALTLFDENGALLDAPRPLWDALCTRDWHGLFVTHRSLWREARLLVFGHALLEKLTAPRKAATAHVLIAPGEMNPDALDDATIAASLHPAHLATKPFTPLPVLGVPGWCVQNENFSFYDDSEVFRPRRAQNEVQPPSPCHVGAA